MEPVITRIEIVDPLILGEGPHWDPSTKSLYFVDIDGETIHKLNPSSNEHFEAKIDGQPGKISLILPIKGKSNEFIITIGRQVGIAKWDGKSNLAQFEKLADVESEEHLAGNRINDGKCDSLGRIWFGSITTPDEKQVFPPIGAFYSLWKGKVQHHFGNVKISNGLAWSSDNTKFFYIDSIDQCVYLFDYDLNNGTLANRRVLFDLSKNGIKGLPDGMTIDADGNLWVAIFNGSCVIQISSREENKLLRKIQLPGKQITSVCFGGEQLNELYVTSARLDPELPLPNNGALYKITNLGCKGFKAEEACL